MDIKRHNDMNTSKFKEGDWIKRKKAGCIAQAASLYSDNQEASDYPDLFSREDIKSAFVAGAQWQAEHTEDYPMPEDTVLFQKGVEEGRRLMMEDAIDGECIDDGTAGVEINTEYGVLFLPPKTFKYEDKVKIIIVKEDER